MSDIPTSGAINLNEIHTEAGGSSGTACTINDSDIRGLIGKSSGVQMDFADWYGASNDPRTTLSGSAALSTAVNVAWYQALSFTFYGYSSGAYGSINNSSWMGKTITAFSYSAYGTNYSFTINAAVFNSGWTSISLYHPYSDTTNPYVFTRSSATYSYNTNANTTTWTWSLNNQLMGYPRNTAFSGTQAQNIVIA